MAQIGKTEYTLRIAGKRQITLPTEFVEAMNLKQGDELRVMVNAPNDIRLIPYARVRRDLITPEIEAILNQRRAAIDGGEKMTAHEEVQHQAAVKNAVRRLRAEAWNAEPAVSAQQDEIAAEG